MKKILVLISLLLYSINSYAVDTSDWSNWDVTKWNTDSLKIIDVRSVYMDVKHYTWALEPFMTPNVPTNAIDLHLDMELLNKTLFWENMVHSETDQYQFALIGWNYKVGAHLGRYLDIFYDHFSQHLLDTTSIVGANTYDALGVRIYFYKRKD